MYGKILVPLDGSTIAEQVLPHLADLAQAFGSEVIVIGVCEPEETEQGKSCSLYIHEQAERLKSTAPKAKYKAEVLFGRADNKILDHAVQEKANIIVMTSHGKSGIMPWSLGSTVSKVLTRTQIPVLVIRASEKQQVKDRLFRKILVPLDGSEKSAAVLPYIAEIAMKFKSEVILIRAVEPGRHVHSVGGLSYVRFKDIDIDKEKNKARKYLEEQGNKLVDTGSKVSYKVAAGESAPEIIKTAKESDCSLIALSSHGHSAFDAWAHGSVTYKILQASNKSVLLVPSSVAITRQSI